jgi:glycosyltransferase involved in cell wall biosynthesis
MERAYYPPGASAPCLWLKTEDVLTPVSLPISLVTPCFDQSHLIEATLRSVIDQGYPALEYIVIDGGSTDGSREVIEKYEPHLAYWVSEPDDGHYPALNKGFAHATGEIMGYLNGDDVLLPGSLSLLSWIFESFPDVEWITGAHVAIDEAARPVSVTMPARWSRWHILSEEMGRFIGQESTFWRRSLWERAGSRMDDSFRLAADFELWARFSRHAPLHTIYAPIGCFRHVAGQASVAQRGDYLDEVRRIREREQELSTNDRRMTKRASRLLWLRSNVWGFGRFFRVFDTGLGAPPEITYDSSAGAMKRTKTSSVGISLRRALGGRNP